MDFFQTISTYFSMVWNSVNEVPLFNTGLNFGNLIFGLIGIRILMFLLKLIFGFDNIVSGISERADKIEQRIGGNRKKIDGKINAKISKARMNDER